MRLQLGRRSGREGGEATAVGSGSADTPVAQMVVDMARNPAGLASPLGPRFAVAGDRVLDARAGAWAQGTVVLVEAGRIAGVSHSAPEGWPVLELPGTS